MNSGAGLAAGLWLYQAATTELGNLKKIIDVALTPIIPVWLSTDEVLSQLSMKRKVQDKYRAYVELGIDEELKPFYGKGKILNSVRGRRNLPRWVALYL